MKFRRGKRGSDPGRRAPSRQARALRGGGGERGGAGATTSALRAPRRATRHAAACSPIVPPSSAPPPAPCPPRGACGWSTGRGSAAPALNVARRKAPDTWSPFRSFEKRGYADRKWPRARGKSAPDGEGEGGGGRSNASVSVPPGAVECAGSGRRDRGEGKCNSNNNQNASQREEEAARTTFIWGVVSSRDAFWRRRGGPEPTQALQITARRPRKRPTS